MTTVISLHERRKYPRVSDAISLKFDHTHDDTPVDPVPTHIVQMSCGGMRFPHDVALDTDTALKLSLYLTSAGKTVHINSRVIASGEEKNGPSQAVTKPYFVQVEFLNIDDNIQLLLENHIEFVIEKTGVKNRLLAYSA